MLMPVDDFLIQIHLKVRYADKETLRRQVKLIE